MKVKFSSPKKHNPNMDGGLPVTYAPAKRQAPKLRWYALVLVISAPLLFLLWRIGIALFVVNAPGVISLDKKSVNSPFPAVVEKIHARPGMKVETGQLLMQLEDPAVTQRIYILRAELEALQSTASGAAQPADGPARAAAAKIRIAEENVRYQKGHRDTIQALLAQGAATRAEAAEAEDRYRQALAALAEARAALAILQVPDFSRQESAAQRSSRIAQIEAELTGLEERRLFFSVISPEEGRILDVFPTEGQHVGGGDALLLLGKPQALNVMAYMQPRHISYARQGEAVEISLPGGIKAAGRIAAAPEIAARIPAELAGVLTEGRQTILVKIEIEEGISDHLRVEGLPVSVHFGFSLRKSLQILAD